MAQNEGYDSLEKYLIMESELIREVKKLNKKHDKNLIKLHLESLKNLYLYHNELCILWNYQDYLIIRRENDL